MTLRDYFKLAQRCWAKADGTLLGDSQPNAGLQQSLVGEPEIAEALAHGFGQSTRGSLWGLRDR